MLPAPRAGGQAVGGAAGFMLEASGEHRHARRRRDRQRREHDAARRRRRRWRDPSRGGSGAARRMPHARRLPDGRGAHHARLSAAGALRHPHGRAGLARRPARRARAARLVLSRQPRARAEHGVRSHRLSRDQLRRLWLSAGKTPCAIAVRECAAGLERHPEIEKITFACFDEHDARSSYHEKRSACPASRRSNMTVIRSKLKTSSAEFRSAADAMRERVAELRGTPRASAGRRRRSCARTPPLAGQAAAARARCRAARSGSAVSRAVAARRMADVTTSPFPQPDSSQASARSRASAA